jgi:tRNA uridine 5-carbamoylmethylation protein Kti12
MRTIVMTIGLPASGKSTYSKELVKKEPGRWKRVSKDDLREMFDCYEFTQSNEKFVEGWREMGLTCFQVAEGAEGNF